MACRSAWPNSYSIDGGVRVLLDLVGIAAAGGLLTVPLYAILQARSDEESRSAAIAGNNVLNAIVMMVRIGCGHRAAGRRECRSSV